jgi:twitching motility protein PilT
MARIDAFLKLGREQGCSDIHFTVGLPPLVRLDGQLTPLKYRDLNKEEVTSIVREILDESNLGRLEESGAVDLSYHSPEVGRFRVNAFHQHQGMAAVARVIPETVPQLADLCLPSVVSDFTGLSSGLVLVTGASGTGKSTTLAAMIDDINRKRNLNIITLEDPIEFVHESKKSLITQREVGSHVHSFSDGLRSALRQDPDVILVGELRDYESISLAIEACETGHLVFGTLHTRGAFQTVHRIVDAFPTEAQSQIQHTLAETLKCVLSQELVRAADGRGRRAVMEILVVTPAVAQMVREGKVFKIPGAISTGRRVGMQLMDQALLQMVSAGDIDPDEAFIKANDRRDLAKFVTKPEILDLSESSSSAGESAA